MSSSDEKGVVYVDTMNLDGETNLKEKSTPKDTHDVKDELIPYLKGTLTCDNPNEFLDKWDGNCSCLQIDRLFNWTIKNLLLRGCFIRNTEFCVGIVVYTGPETKIMMNSKKPPTKVSNVMKMMNKMLYTVFAFQIFLLFIFSSLSVVWNGNVAEDLSYLDLEPSGGFGHFIIQMLTYWVAYSHLIPISLYVVLEMVKISQAVFINNDMFLWREETGYAKWRNSDLIEELGQVEFIFSDKTGTLTCNVMEYKECTVGSKVYPSISEFRESISKGDSDEKTMCHEYIQCLALCHSVVVDKDENTQEKTYQASSPDELALVEGAKMCGIEYTEKYMNFIQIADEWTDSTREYEVIIEFPFDSTRKRMSLLCKEMDDENIIMYMKGADSIMLPRLNLNQRQQDFIEAELHNFAKKGLRTLVMAKKILTKEVYDEWHERYNTINVSNDLDKDDKLAELYDELEYNFEYVGWSAIEDLLQDQVPETIADLMSANIKLWVLTGDKQETAIEIGKSCNLINESEMELIIMSSKTKDDFIHILTEYLLNPPSKEKIWIVIDGHTLTFVLEDENLAKAFFQYGCKANSVVWCRVSPKQKSDVVGLAKRNGNWITLAIGDGANDVSMILEAHIGIGIKGKEGTQAARTADYAIGDFKSLKDLLFVHGRWGYRRISMFIWYYFYKNVILVFCELYFAFINGYSGQIYFTDYLPMLYNAVFTSWPCIGTFVFERDVTREKSLKTPQLYMAGHKKYYFNYREFWKWIILALYHGMVTYFIPMYGLFGPTDKHGRTSEHWVISTVSFSIILHVVTYKLYVDTYFWSKLNIIFSILSIVIFYITVTIGSIPAIANLIQPEASGVFFIVAANPKFWFIIIICPFICLLPDITLITIQRSFYK